MRTANWIFRGMFPAILAGVALVVAGCAESTRQDEVTEAQQDLREEEQETAAAARERQQEMGESQGEAQTYTVGKPVVDEAAEQRTADEQRAATQARDDFVRTTQQKLANAEARIDELKASAAGAEGEAKETMDRTINSLQSQHDRAGQALNDLKSAKLTNWQAHRETVQVALRDLDTMMSNIR